MKIIYLCPTGLHTALVAAGLHLGRLPAEKAPAGDEIIGLSREYHRPGHKLGKPVFVGRDEAGHDVFTIGVASEHVMLKKAVVDLLERVYGINRHDFQVVDVALLANRWVRLGNFLSTRMKLYRAGDRLCAYGIRKRYKDIWSIVEEVKKAQ